MLLNANDTATVHKVGLDLKQQMLTSLQTPQAGKASVSDQINQSLQVVAGGRDDDAPAGHRQEPDAR